MPSNKGRCGEGTSRPLLDNEPRSHFWDTGGLPCRLTMDAVAAEREAPESNSQMYTTDDTNPDAPGAGWVDRMACAAGILEETEQNGEVSYECGLDKKGGGGAGDRGRKTALGDDDQVKETWSLNIRRLKRGMRKLVKRLGANCEQPIAQYKVPPIAEAKHIIPLKLESTLTGTRFFPF